MRARCWVTLLLGLCLGACSDYDLARRAYEGGQYGEAVQRYEVLAQAGDGRAQYDLAQMYFQGIGTAKEPDRGWFWLLKAAGGTNVAAMIQLGALFESGVGAPRDYAMAAQWYLRAAQHGDPVGRYNLAAMYVKGIGVPRDEVAALAWFQLSLDAGTAAAREQIETLEGRLTPDQVRRARELATRLSESAKNVKDGKDGKDGKGGKDGKDGKG